MRYVHRDVEDRLVNRAYIAMRKIFDGEVIELGRRFGSLSSYGFEIGFLILRTLKKNGL
jgi:hypothetical protein